MTKKVNIATVHNAIASAIDGAITTSQTIGAELVTQCVTVCQKFYRGKEIPKDDREAILDTLAVMRGWSDKSAKSRKSEARALLQFYPMLLELVAGFRKKNGGNCTWHDVVKLAREVGKHSGKRRVTSAVNALIERSEATAVKPGDLKRSEAKAKIAASVKTILKMKAVESAFRVSLAELCEEYRISV